MRQAIISYVMQDDWHGILTVEHDTPMLNGVAPNGYSQENQQRYARAILTAFENSGGWSLTWDDDAQCERTFCDMYKSIVVWDDSLAGYISVDLAALDNGWTIA